METEITKRLEMLESKIDAIYSSVEKTRKYFLWTMVISLAVVVLPLIGLLFVVPMFIGTYANQFEGLL